MLPIGFFGGLSPLRLRLRFVARRRLRPRLCICVLALFAFFCFGTNGFGAESSVGSLKPSVLQSDSPLHIASDRMEASQKDKTILFEGHVQVRQDDLTITGNLMRVYAAEGKKAAKPGDKSGDKSGAKPGDGPGDPAMMDQIDRIEVEGNVKITQKEKMATAEKAVYYHQARKIVLMGNPTVAQGQDKVAGRVITLYLAEERSVVEGSERSPVQAVLHPARKE